MARGLSNQQKQILQVLNRTGECGFYFDFMPNIKFELFPALWGKGLYSVGRVINYGCDKNKKNSARVCISKSLNRLLKRELIEYIDFPGRPGLLKIKLTDKGYLMVNEVP